MFKAIVPVFLYYYHNHKEELFKYIFELKLRKSNKLHFTARLFLTLALSVNFRTATHMYKTYFH